MITNQLSLSLSLSLSLILSPIKADSIISGPNLELKVLKERIEAQNLAIEEQDLVIYSLKNRICDLETELKRQIQGLSLSRGEYTFRFFLPDMFEFFKVPSNTFEFPRFWGKGRQWSVRIECNQNESQEKSLGVYLCYHRVDSLPNLPLCNCKFTLFHRRFENRDKVLEFDHHFKKDESFGWSSFISYRELIKKKNGYIRGNTIWMGLELKIDSMVRE